MWSPWRRLLLLLLLLVHSFRGAVSGRSINCLGTGTRRGVCFFLTEARAEYDKDLCTALGFHRAEPVYVEDAEAMYAAFEILGEEFFLGMKNGELPVGTAEGEMRTRLDEVSALQKKLPFPTDFCGAALPKSAPGYLEFKGLYAAPVCGTPRKHLCEKSMTRTPDDPPCPPGWRQFGTTRCVYLSDHFAEWNPAYCPTLRPDATFMVLEDGDMAEYVGLLGNTTAFVGVINPKGSTAVWVDGSQYSPAFGLCPDCLLVDRCGALRPYAPSLVTWTDCARLLPHLCSIERPTLPTTATPTSQVTPGKRTMTVTPTASVPILPLMATGTTTVEGVTVSVTKKHPVGVGPLSTPTLSPAVAPPERPGLPPGAVNVVRQSNKVTAVATAFRMVASAAGAGHAPMLALIAGLQCHVDDVDLKEAEPLDWEFHPTGVGIGEGSDKYFLGAVVMNPAIVLSVMAFFTAVAVAVRCFGTPSWRKALGNVRTPGLAFVPTMFLLQGTTLSASHLLFSHHAKLRVVGVCVLVACSLLPLTAWMLLLRPSCFYATVVTDAKLAHTDFPHRLTLFGWRAKVYNFVFGRDIWVSTKEHFVEMYGVVFECYRKGMQWFLIVEQLWTIGLSLFAAWRPESPLQCHARNVLISLFLFLFLLLLLTFHPFTAPMDNILMTANSMLVVAAVVLITVSLSLSTPSEGTLNVSGVLLLISAVLTTFKALNDFLLYTIDMYMRRKLETRTKHLAEDNAIPFLLDGYHSEEELSSSAAHHPILLTPRHLDETVSLTPCGTLDDDEVGPYLVISPLARRGARSHDLSILPSLTPRPPACISHRPYPSSASSPQGLPNVPL